MDKSLFIFIAVGVGFLYFITNFIGEIQEKDDRFSNSEYAQKQKHDKYLSKDAIGQKILDVKKEENGTQIEIWQNSTFKEELLMLFPEYDEMKKFVKERTRGDFLQKRLLEVISKVEGEFLSGTLSVEDAKRLLGTLK